MAIVLHHSRSRGTDKVVLLGIANHDGDGGAWPTLATLARYANVDVRNVRAALRRLESAGEIRTHLNDGGTRRTPGHERPNRYEITICCPVECDRTSNHRMPGDYGYSCRQGGMPASPPPRMPASPPPRMPASPPPRMPASPEPSLEPSDEPSLPPSPQPNSTTADMTGTPGGRGNSQKASHGEHSISAGHTDDGKPAAGQPDLLAGREDDSLDKALHAVVEGVGRPDLSPALLASSPLRAAVTALVRAGVTSRALRGSCEAHRWAGAGAGAVVRYVQGLRAGDLVVRAPVGPPECPEHPGQPAGRCRECERSSVPVALVAGLVEGLRAAVRTSHTVNV
jgi:hypothetical protein